MQTISKHEVKLIQLYKLGMLNPKSKSAVKEDLIQAIRDMGILQIDTISVVNRAPYFTLWSRLGNYPTQWLEETHKEGLLFEYWAHAACFIPIEEYTFFRSKMPDDIYGGKLSEQWYNEHYDVIQLVMSHIEKNGPTCSADFKVEKQPGGWWNWKEEKIALENLWHRGDLMVAYRKGFQRYYDLQNKVLPNYNKNGTPTLDEAKRYWVEKTILTLGATIPKWVSDYYRLKKTDTAKIINTLLNEAVLIEYECPELGENILVHKEQLDLVDKAQSGELIPTHSTLLNPFDPLIWDRERLLALFNFDYSIECYLPAAKRKYGYFSLPILYKGSIVGRLDAKAHRKEKRFEIRQLHFEESFTPHTDFTSIFETIVQNCADWHNCPQVEYSSTIKPPFK